MKRCTNLLLLFLLVVASAATLFAQATASGSIQGTVVDKSQAVVTGADVGHHQQDDRQLLVRSSPATPAITVSIFYPPVPTQLRSPSPGFSSVVQNVDLLVGQTTTANATLNLGATSETVEVTGVAPSGRLGQDQRQPEHHSQ